MLFFSLVRFSYIRQLLIYYVQLLDYCVLITTPFRTNSPSKSKPVSMSRMAGFAVVTTALVRLCLASPLDSILQININIEFLLRFLA